MDNEDNEKRVVRDIICEYAIHPTPAKITLTDYNRPNHIECKNYHLIYGNEPGCSASADGYCHQVWRKVF